MDGDTAYRPFLLPEMNPRTQQSKNTQKQISKFSRPVQFLLCFCILFQIFCPGLQFPFQQFSSWQVKINQKFLLSHHCITYLVVLRMLRSERGYVFYKKSDLQNIAKFREKHEPNFDKVKLASLLKRLWHTCFPLNFSKLLRTALFIKHFRVTALKLLLSLKLKVSFVIIGEIPIFTLKI